MKRKSYPAYKPSGVEWLSDVPEHWVIKRLKDICRFAYGDSLASEDREEGAFLVYGSNGTIGTHSETNTKAPVIVIGRKGSYGKINFSNKPVFAIDTTYFVDSAQTKNDLYWLSYLLHNLKLDVGSKDSAVPGLAREDAYKNYVPLPPLPEQQSIAAFLDRETRRIDELVTKKERLIKLLREKRSALISHVVTRGLDPSVKLKPSGVEWLGVVPEHWEVKRLKDVLVTRRGAIKTGPFGSQLLSSEMMEGEVKVYNQRNVLDNDFVSGENYVSEEKFIELKEFRTYPGDILITTRGTIGRCAVLPQEAEKGILHPCLMRLQINKDVISERYLEILIQDSGIVLTQLQIKSNSTTIEVIYQESLKNVIVFLPPLSEQQSIAAFLDRETGKIDALIAKVETVITKLKEYRTALISAAVTGKIDVREAA